MTNPTATIRSSHELRDPAGTASMETLRAGLQLARASQLTMLRFQLALHQSSRRTAMQALDTLLDMDAEMEGLTATLAATSSLPTGDAQLSGFIGRQKAAIAAEKHVLTGGDWPSDHEAIAIAAPRDEANEPAPLLLEDTVESGERARWGIILAVAAVVLLAALGLAAWRVL
ncbi:hypothetical protein F9288_05480 [Sphingomonas sp. CL5.1]|uniref:hypothetical protein n=1 Tax=Sphingomonas sp. CL5.1 TaxID=2653203 RepID=UPI0015823B45|nr:hypothetical protein [Sphingomonas sp. CL5.1]QKR99165.1 hypothetical protein F9288_05480 [Sphingomonas sp. CL5.1]